MHDYEAQVIPLRAELTRAALRLTRDEGRAADLVQETLMRAWLGWSGFRAGTNARAWTHRILRNAFINQYRRSQREAVAMRAFRQHPRERRYVPVLPGYSDAVEKALGELPATFRDAVLAVDAQGLGYSGASEALGCPVGTIMSRVHRGRRRLRQALQGYATEEGYLRRDAA